MTVFIQYCEPACGDSTKMIAVYETNDVKRRVCMRISNALTLTGAQIISHSEV